MYKDVRFCGLPIIKVKKTENYEKRYFLGIQYKTKKFTRRYDHFTEAFSENVNGISGRNIKVILANLGEAVVYARTAAFWHKKDDLVFGVRQAHAEIFRMFAPEVPVFFCGEARLDKPEYVNGNHFEAVLFDSDLIEMNNTKQPFLKSWEKHLKADFSTIEYKKAVISKPTEICAIKKAEALKINLNKFVFLMPFARSVDLLPKEFWEKLENDFKTKGYDVVYNSKMFSVEEAYVLASKAKAIVGLRSGFCDVLCELNVPQHIIYGHNDWHGDLQPMYSFADFPWAAHHYISEYKLHNQSLADIKQNILNKVEG